MSGFNYQNAICGLGIRESYIDKLDRMGFRVDWGGGALQHDVSLVCEQIEVCGIGEQVVDTSIS